MSGANPQKWFPQWVDWLLATLDRIRDIRSKADPVNSAIRYQTIVVPRLGKMNRNGRIYTREVAERMCGQFKEPMLGEIGHPDSSSVMMSNASHAIRKVFIDGNDLWAEYSVLDTPCGRLLYDLFQQQGEDAFALRPSGRGTVINGHIEDGYELITFNFIPVSEDAFRPYTEEETLRCGLDAFGDKWAFYRWVDRPSEIYEGMTPRQLMAEGRYDDVMMELGRIQYGIY